MIKDDRYLMLGLMKLGCNADTWAGQEVSLTWHSPGVPAWVAPAAPLPDVGGNQDYREALTQGCPSQVKAGMGTGRCPISQP